MREIGSTLSVFTDGGARGNPGEAGIGVYITDEKKNVISEFGKKIGIATNNVAEYKAVLEALVWIINNKNYLKKIKKINFFLDSQLVYSQITGLYKVKDSKLRNLLFSVREKEAQIGIRVLYTHIPREQNKKADLLVNMALDLDYPTLCLFSSSW